MRNVYVVADNIYSPLGRNTRDNIEALKQGRSGIQLHTGHLWPDPIYASLFDATFKVEDESKTFFEQIVLASALDAIQKADGAYLKLLVQPGDGVSPIVEAINTAKKSVEMELSLVSTSIPKPGADEVIVRQ